MDEVVNNGWSDEQMQCGNNNIQNLTKKTDTYSILGWCQINA